MKQLPIPSPCNDHSIRFRTWQKMAEFVKKKYEQPLHYLTNIQLKQWDESTGDENRPIAGNIIHPSKAEAIIWGVEEFNRKCSSHLYLAKLWHSDPKYRDFVDLVNS
ncbi:hypothetical protein SLEP1_g37503 [Rubroshorea leprosula]|uniref:Uncharacterized protein n=1 Tax=Rubroshorea leprosula TaxID=152421 RepID=A0AAV5KUS6_9ROSI|nr:hypothetical protein SLEP1_g37503 [Rubroshorea leprosula]